MAASYPFLVDFPFFYLKVKVKLRRYELMQTKTGRQAVATETTPERAADPQHKLPCFPLPQEGHLAVIRGQSWAIPPQHQRRKGQDIHRMPWKLTFIKLKPEALVLPTVCAMAPGQATGLTFLYLEIRR